MQPKLLRVLEEKEFERVGGTTLVKSDFRLLAATNHNLEAMLAENRFRTDLFYRLNAITPTIPPLRDRREDILPIAGSLLKQIAADGGLSEVSLSREAEDFLVGYDWPGNVRELSNVLYRAAHYAERDRLTVADLPRYLFQRGKAVGAINAATLRHVQQSAERDAIRRALEAVGYNKAQAARHQGIHRSLSYKKLKKCGVPLRKENARQVAGPHWLKSSIRSERDTDRTAAAPRTVRAAAEASQCPTTTSRSTSRASRNTSSEE